MPPNPELTLNRTRKPRAPRNRTLELTETERRSLVSRLIEPGRVCLKAPEGIVAGDSLALAAKLPRAFADLLVLDPPYNMSKDFGGLKFGKRSVTQYAEWLDGVIRALKHTLKPDATVYICGDWYSSASIMQVASEHFIVRNRITWEREKGRGASANWKNSSEDIWFCTVSERFHFDVEAVKLRRRVLAPYTDSTGTPKDWVRGRAGNYRDTHPSNLWSDITIPFWSMPENTDHPTQKSEKLVAKLLLASSKPGALVFDPFMGSGTTCVVAKKLSRRFLGIEINQEYALWALKRLAAADADKTIQGYAAGVFWERNSSNAAAAAASDDTVERDPRVG